MLRKPESNPSKVAQCALAGIVRDSYPIALLKYSDKSNLEEKMLISVIVPGYSSSWPKSQGIRNLMQLTVLLPQSEEH